MLCMSSKYDVIFGVMCLYFACFPRFFFSFQNKREILKLSKEDQNFPKIRFSFFKQKILNIPSNLRQFISKKAQAAEQGKQEFLMKFLTNCGINEILIQGMGFIWKIHYGTTDFFFFFLIIKNLLPKGKSPTTTKNKTSSLKSP